MGKLIVIEGVDASGKQTQTELLYKYMTSLNDKVIKIEFPDYESASSAPVKMYLNGDFGKDAGSVNPYAASTFFAVDRFASYKTKWERKYRDDYIIIADRYVTANMIYQASKLADANDKQAFCEWVCDFEYKKLGLPVPDLKIFLDVKPEISFELMAKRKNKFTGEEALDIHENDKEYLIKTYENARFIADNYGFITVDCVRNGALRSIEDIHNEICRTVKENIYAD